MFPRSSRLERNHFEAVLKEGKAFHTAHFSLRIAEKKGLDKGLFSVVVPKAVAKNAVVRNKVKRRVRALLKECIPSSPLLTAIFVKKGATALSIDEYRSELSQLMSKVK
jgi:ribonuclease P protein component